MKKKKKWNPSSRKEKAEEGESTEVTLLKLRLVQANKRANLFFRKLKYERKFYRKLIKFVLLFGVIIGIIIGFLLGGLI